MRRRIVAMAARPALWMGLLLVWIECSALRSWHTPYARVALTEALRWSAGLSMALTLALGLRRTGSMAQALTVLLALFVAAAVAAGRSQGMLTGLYNDHQLCASALLALLPFSVALGLAAPRPSWRWIGQGVALAALVCLALTETRSAWAGAAVGSVMFTWLWLRRTVTMQPRRLSFFLIPLLMAAALAGVFFVQVQGTEMAAPLAARAATLNALAQDGSWQWRLQTWRGDLSMIADHPWIGWGLGHYPSDHWAFTHLDRRLLPGQRPSLSDQAHDLYLQTTAELGLVGLALYLAVLLSTAALLWTKLSERLHRAKDSRSTFRAALLIAALTLLAAQAVDAVASPSWQFAEVSLLFWLGIGMGLAACRPASTWAEDAPLPAIVCRRLQYAAAGFACLLLTAQIIPTALISPALANPQENYSPTLTGLAIVIGPALGSNVANSLPAYYEFYATASYSDGSTADVTANTVFSSGIYNTSFMKGPEGLDQLEIFNKTSRGVTGIISGKYTEGSTTESGSVSFTVPANA